MDKLKKFLKDAPVTFICLLNPNFTQKDRTMQGGNPEKTMLQTDGPTN